MEEPDQENPYAPPTASSERRLSPRLSVTLGVILLIVIAVAFLLDVSLGVGVVLVAIPAYARAVRLSSIRAAKGLCVSNLDRILAFLGSVGVVVGCVVAGAIAFFTTCTGLVFSGAIATEAGGVITIVLSVAGFLFAVVWIYRLTWPSKPRPPST